MEQNFPTIAQIEVALKSLQIKFLGPEKVNRNNLIKFKQSHWSNNTLTSLFLWHKIKPENPVKILGYTFWCQKV